MVERLYLCPNCFNALEAVEINAACLVCGHQLIECRPGAPDDPCRKPLMNAGGELLTHAPQWWIEHYRRLSVQSSQESS